eukprot:COSAG01_NODE_4363_length_5095_cov_2.354484_6_plen_398_part_00
MNALLRYSNRACWGTAGGLCLLWLNWSLRSRIGRRRQQCVSMKVKAAGSQYPVVASSRSERGPSRPAQQQAWLQQSAQSTPATAPRPRGLPTRGATGRATAESEPPPASQHRAMEPEPEMSGGGPLPGGQFETLLPGGAVSKAGIVFKAKDASGAVVNRWPQVFKIKSGSWAAEMAGDELRPGCALVSINDAPVTTLEAAKTQLSAAQKLCTYDQPFIRMVWQRAEEADPPGGVDAAPRDLSFPVRRWHDTQWCRCWLTFSAGVVKVYDSPGFGSRPDTAQAEPMVTFDMSDGVTRWESDAISRERMILDNSAQLAHLKFGDADACRCAAACTIVDNIDHSPRRAASSPPPPCTSQPHPRTPTPPHVRRAERCPSVLSVWRGSKPAVLSPACSRVRI